MANPSYGTLTLLDTLATIDKDNAFTYGEDRLYANLQDLLTAHNAMTQDMFDMFVAQTNDKIRRYGGQAVGGVMIEADEWGAADVQKTAVSGYNIGFPLRSYQYALGWTKKYFEVKAVSDIAKEFIAARDADVKNLKTQVLRALLRASNYTFTDRLDNQVDLPVKALQNADSSNIPYDEYGNSFNSATHTHLLARVSTLAASDITAAIDTVVEHGVGGGQVVVLLNRAQEAAVSAFTPFTPLQAPLIDPGGGSTDDVPVFARDNPYRIDDKPIGIWDGYVVVHVKPWVPANYILVVLVNANQPKVLAMRTRPIAGYGDFRLVANDDHFPLRAQWFEREFGMSVWGRLQASVLYVGGTSYVTPSFPTG